MRHPYGTRAARAALNEEEIRQFLANDFPGLVANLTLVTGSREEAEDAVQEALARAWLRTEGGEVIVALRAWVGVVALNVARSRFRRLRAERAATELVGSRTLLSARWEEAEPAADVAVGTRELLRELPRRQREVAFLHYYLDLPVRDAATLLGISVGTAKKALHRAREAFTRSMEEAESSDVAR